MSIHRIFRLVSLKLRVPLTPRTGSFQRLVDGPGGT